MERSSRIMTCASIRGRRWGAYGYLCLNDIARLAGRRVRVANWLHNRSTLEHLAAWERSYNPAFNGVEFDLVRDSTKKEGNYRLSVHQWVEATNAIGLRALEGRHGGTYAVIDIAMHFTRWVTPTPLYPVRAKPVFRNQTLDAQYVARTLEKQLVPKEPDTLAPRSSLQ